MKLWRIVALLFFLIGSAKAQTTVLDTIRIGGIYRPFRYYIPASYQPGNPTALVFNFHGLNSSAVIQENYGDFRPIADTAGFIVVHPHGLALGNNTGWFSFWSVTQAQADLAFANAILDTLSRRLTLDPERFYSTGMSNGGFMTYDIACFMNLRFAAVASVTGTMVPEHFDQCVPGRAMPLLHFHGTNDATVPYSGVGGSMAFVHVDSLMNFWVRNNGCNPVPVVQAVPDINTTDNSSVTCYTWNNGRGGSEVVLYRIQGGGHSWPGSSFSSPTSITNQDIKASQLIWQFFRKFQKTTVVSVKESAALPALSIGPNPGNGWYQVTWEGRYPATLCLFDCQGKKVSTHPLNSGTSVLDLHALPSGLYFYTTDEKVPSRGKLLHQ